jgi:hypothetical protein
VRLSPLGAIHLPAGYTAYQTRDVLDAWFGSIESGDGRVTIRFRSGLAEGAFGEARRDEDLWLREAEGDWATYRYGVGEKDGRSVVGVSIADAGFRAEVESEADVEEVRRVVGT